MYPTESEHGGMPKVRRDRKCDGAGRLSPNPCKPRPRHATLKSWPDQLLCHDIVVHGRVTLRVARSLRIRPPLL